MNRTGAAALHLLVVSMLLLTACGSGAVSGATPAGRPTGAAASSPSPVGPTAAPTSVPTAVPTGTPAANPALGRPWAPGQKGYGEVRPATIFNGGDPTGLVQQIVWQSWGGAMATGIGISEYVGPNQSVADGAQERATVVAFKPGDCQNTLMYQAVEWYFPQHGQSFDPNAYIDICTGTYVGQR
jgi:hypothetical protein